MQTFLPYESFTATAKVLDNKRLGKQRVEGLQILKSLILEKYGWKNHPAVKMWKGSEYILIDYTFAIITEWKERCYHDTVFYDIQYYIKTHHDKLGTKIPLWLGNEKLHSSHRAALLAKNFDFYKKFKWNEKPELNYYWP